MPPHGYRHAYLGVIVRSQYFLLAVLLSLVPLCSLTAQERTVEERLNRLEAQVEEIRDSLGLSAESQGSGYDRGHMAPGAAFIMPNSLHRVTGDPIGFLVSVDHVEELSGLEFYPLLPDSTEIRLERLNQTNWPIR